MLHGVFRVSVRNRKRLKKRDDRRPLIAERSEENESERARLTEGAVR